MELLLGDLASCDRSGIELTVTLADNNSDPPTSSASMPANLSVDVVRLDRNAGGSGGFSAAMAHVLGRRGSHADRDPPDFLLLLDSDVRVTRGALRVLVDVLSGRDDLVGVGPELRDTVSGRSYEIGAIISQEHGGSIPVHTRDVLPYQIVPCDYIASCCLLVRREAVEQTGLFPDAFLYLDDIDWCLALREATGHPVAAVPGAIVYHPWWWRRVLPGRRYHLSRNCLAPLERLRMSGAQRFRRTMGDVGMAVGMASLGLGELAREHINGLADAAAGRTTGKGRAGTVGAPPTRPVSELAAVIRAQKGRLGRKARVFVHPVLAAWHIGYEDVQEQLSLVDLDPIDFRLWHSTSAIMMLLRTAWEVVRRLVIGARADVAVVPLEWSTTWVHGTKIIAIAGGEFVELRPRLWKTLPVAAWCAAAGVWHSLRLRRRGPGVWALPKVFDQAGTTVTTHGPAQHPATASCIAVG